MVGLDERMDRVVEKIASMSKEEKEVLGLLLGLSKEELKEVKERLRNGRYS